MPTVLETAKEATYTALGLNVLIFDEITERFAGQREQLDEQLDIARDHAKKAQTDWEKQSEQFTAQVKERMPFDVDQVTETIQSRVQPVVRRTWEAAEPTVNRLTEMAPAPVDGYMKDGVAKVRELIIDEPAKAKPAAKKPAAKKAPAKKAAAKKTTARKPAAKKAASK